MRCHDTTKEVHDNKIGHNKVSKVDTKIHIFLFDADRKPDWFQAKCT